MELLRAGRPRRFALREDQSCDCKYINTLSYETPRNEPENILWLDQPKQERTRKRELAKLLLKRCRVHVVRRGGVGLCSYLIDAAPRLLATALCDRRRIGCSRCCAQCAHHRHAELQKRRPLVKLGRARAIVDRKRKRHAQPREINGERRVNARFGTLNEDIVARNVDVEVGDSLLRQVIANVDGMNETRS